MSSSPLAEQLSRHFINSRCQLIRRLKYSYPGFCVSHIEDAVDRTALIALESLYRPGSPFERAWLQDGRAGLSRLYYTVAWRAMRTRYRKPSTSRERYQLRPPDRVDDANPESWLEANRSLERLEGLIEEASQRFSKNSSQALHDALVHRLTEGSSDVVAAKRYAVDRTLVCRARNWVREQLAA